MKPKTRQQLARDALISEGYNSAADIPESCLGRNSERNREIVQAVIFDNVMLPEAGKRFGLSREEVRRVGLVSTRKCIGRYSNEDLEQNETRS